MRMPKKPVVSQALATTSLASQQQEITALSKRMLPVIKTPQQQASVVELVAQAGKVRSSAQTAMKATTAPLKAQVKTLEAAWKPVIELADRVIEQGKLAVQAFISFQEHERQKRLKEREEAIAKASADYDAAEAKLDTADTTRRKNAALAKIQAAETAMLAASQAPTPVATSIQTNSGTVSMRGGRWTYEVINEETVPVEFLSVDREKVMAVIRLGVREVPGLRIYQPQIMALGGVREES